MLPGFPSASLPAPLLVSGWFLLSPLLAQGWQTPGLRVCTSYQCDPSFSLTHPLWLSLFLCTLAVLLPLEYASSWAFVQDTYTAHPHLLR